MGPPGDGHVVVRVNGVVRRLRQLVARAVLPPDHRDTWVSCAAFWILFLSISLSQFKNLLQKW